MAGVEFIAKWQQAISPERDAEEQPPIAHLYIACSELYANILAILRNQPSIERSTVVSLERSHGYLVLWADGYGVENGQLDNSLNRSRRARQSTVRLLMSVCQTLTGRKFPLDLQLRAESEPKQVYYRLLRRINKRFSPLNPLRSYKQSRN